MWTIYLVEDEEYVRQTILELLDWESHGFLVAGEAGGGEEALQGIRKHRPDIVLADIVMPGMDGIELLRRVREEGIPSKFIMLTAMSDFEYARDALQYGASNYLLKLSLDEQLLLDNLLKLKAVLMQELERAGESLHPLYYRVWEEMGKRSGEAAPTIRGPEIPEPFRELELTVFTRLGSEPAAWERVAATVGLDDSHTSIVHSFVAGGQTTYFRWNKTDRDRGESTGVSDAPEPYGTASCVHAERLADAWRTSSLQLDRYWYEGERPPIAEPSTTSGLYEMEAELMRCFEERNESRCIELMKVIWGQMEAAGYSHLQAKQTAARLGGTFARLAGRSELSDDFVYAALTHKQLLADLIGYAMAQLRTMNEQEGMFTDHPEINAVIRYMQEHYRESMTVKDLAKRVAMNVDYLSTLFRRKTGQSPITYLQRIRIERAKRMLDESQRNVGEIGELCGFADDAYFIKLFKREVGLTPSAYRKAASKN